MLYSVVALTLVFGLSSALPTDAILDTRTLENNVNVQVGVRPEFLVNNMDNGSLKKKLQSCSEGPFKTTDFSVSHRGAALEFPEHTEEGYRAARRQGAGVIECDVSFTKDKKLVCRHSQCDMHYTTNVLTIPALAAKCSKPFKAASPGAPATASCCTSDFTLKEFKSLCGRMEATMNPNATVLAEFLKTPVWRTDLYATCGTLMSHQDFIKQVDGYGLKFTSEVKTPEIPMPYLGWTQETFAQEIVNEYKKAGIKPSRVYLQSFLPADIFYYIKAEPSFAKQAVYLDERVDSLEGYNNAVASIPDLAKKGVKILGPAFFALTELDANKNIVPSAYAIAAKKAGIKLLPWSFERSGPLSTGGGYYYTFVSSIINNDGDMLTVLDVLAKKVGIIGIFSDWPATVTYYANCMGL